VLCTLEAIVAGRSLFALDLPPRVSLYRTFLKILNSVPLNNQKSQAMQPATIAAAERNLDSIPPKARQAFLLVAVEEFSSAEAAAVLDVSSDELQDLVTEAEREIAEQIATDVVIIEDEPLIALDLVQLVTDLGHRVVEIAPQHLLSGTRPEPTFLITKPFRYEYLKAMISQALFFDIRARPERPPTSNRGPSFPCRVTTLEQRQRLPTTSCGPC
jgi:hypothetical protein